MKWLGRFRLEGGYFQRSAVPTHYSAVRRMAEEFETSPTPRSLQTAGPQMMKQTAKEWYINFPSALAQEFSRGETAEGSSPRQSEGAVCCYQPCLHYIVTLCFDRKYLISLLVTIYSKKLAWNCNGNSRNLSVVWSGKNEVGSAIRQTFPDGFRPPLMHNAGVSRFRHLRTGATWTGRPGGAKRDPDIQSTGTLAASSAICWTMKRPR